MSKHSAAALETLNRAIEVDSNCAEAYILLGVTEFQRGETANAVQHYKRALQLQPRSYSGHYNLALAYLREHRVQEGRTELERAAKLDPRQGDAAYDLGMVLLGMGEPSRALVHLRRARELNPGRPDVAFNIVRGELEAGQISEAAAEAQASAKRLGSDFQWNTAIGQLFLKNAQPTYATIYFRQAKRLHPDDSDIRRQLAAACLASSNPEGVLSAIPEPKTADDHFLRASAYYLSHRFPEADQESEHALAQAPDNVQVLDLRVRLLQRAGEQDAALAMAQKAIARAPKWDEPYYLAGVSHYFLQHYDDASQNLARALELNPDSTRALFLQATIFGNHGNPREAEQRLRRAIALEPKNARFHCHLGIVLARENERSQAEASFRTAIQLKPDYALPHYELGKILAHSNQFKQAAEELNQAVTHDPGLSAAYYQLARVYAKLGETEKSKRVLADFLKLDQQQINDSQAADRAVDEDARKETQ